jgi:hypothetical protein
MWEAEARRSLVQGQPRLYNETLFEKERKEKREGERERKEGTEKKGKGREGKGKRKKLVLIVLCVVVVLCFSKSGPFLKTSQVLEKYLVVE